MRRVWLAPALLAVALVIQLTVVDGLHLPRGGVPDLVLVLVVALAMAYGPVPGMVTGFAAGLCADIAPPGSPLIGQYALVFCLAGWAAGSLGRFTKRSPLRAVVVAAAVIAGAETIAAGLGKLLEPDQVSVAEIRQFLPPTIAYDLVICPFALYLVILAATTKASRGPATSALAGTGLLSVAAHSKQSRATRRTHEPRLDPAAAKAGDGWVGGGPGRHPSGRPRTHRTRLHPGTGQAGSASGYAQAQQTRLPARPVKLRLSAGRHGAAAIGNTAGSGQGRHWQSGRHPGMMAGAGHRIRFGGELGGAAARQPAPATTGSTPLRINFRARLGGSAAGRPAPARPGLKPLRINFSADGGDSIRTGNGGLTRASRTKIAAPRLRMGSSRSALAIRTTGTPARSVPTVHFHAAPRPIARRPAVTPKFRGSSRRRRPARLSTGLAIGGVGDQAAFRARQTATAPSRLRLSGRRRGLGMLGGSGQSTLRRPPPSGGKKPQFGYGRRSPLTFLTRRRLGGRWLARLRAGRRSGPWLIGKRTGRLR